MRILVRPAVRGGTTARLLGLVAVLLLLSAAPVGAAATAVLAPSADATATGAFEVRARVTADEGEVVERVDARLVGPGERTVQMQPDGDRQPDGSGDWIAAIDPLDGIALANGRYQVEVRTTPLVGEPSPYQGHQVHLEVPPPQRALTARPGAEDPTAVELSWDTVALPDFLAYRVQRRPDDGGTWRTVHALTDPRQGSVVDDVPAGRYRYRLVVVRSDGGGSELFATSDPRGVRADPADPGTFDPPREPDPEPTAPPPGGGVAPISRPTDDVAQGPQPGTAETSTAVTPNVRPGVTVRPPSTGADPQPAPPAPRPAVVPFDDGVFEELLPFEEPGVGTADVTETEAAFIDGGLREGGSLNIYTEEQQPRSTLVAIASGLLLLVLAGHLRRYLSAGSRR